MYSRQSYEELKNKVLLDSLKPLNQQDPTLKEAFRNAKLNVPEPTTRNMGLQPQVNSERERILTEENISHEPFSKRARNNQENYDYVEEHQVQAEQAHIQRAFSISKSITSNINDLTIRDKKVAPVKTEFTIFDEDEAFEPDIEIYSNREFNLIGFDSYPDLPIRNTRVEIINFLEKNNIIIIQGNTGCGKTTQVPQMILDHAANLNRHCNIVVTQPRRLAAVSVCKRVCDERRWRMGTICGFKFQTDRKLSSKTRILYLTTGSLIQSIISNEDYIKKYTHVILDEIHERDLDTDLIILLLKMKLLGGFTGKLILMSATLDPIIFQEYFRSVAKQSSIMPVENYSIPVVKCSFNRFEVELLYLDDIKNILELSNHEMPKLNYSDPGLYDESIEITTRLLRYFDQIESEDPNQDTIDGFACNRGSVLIFISGLSDIGRLQSHIKITLPEAQLIILPLHSDFGVEQQAEVFKQAPAAYRKVIISTSIAESSITVPDVKYVIDFCLTKSLYCDEMTNYTELRCEWATKSNLDQRRGRAGRVSDGRCFRLITKDFVLNEYPSPAIERQPLDKLILNIKRLNPNESPKVTFSMALTKPKLDKIERTMLILKEVGAISLYKVGELSAVDGDLTYAGSIMADLPVDIRLAKLILFGHVFGKLREAIIIAASLSVKDLYTKHYRSNLEAYRTKFSYSEGLFCDFNCIINTYNVYEETFNDENVDLNMSRYRAKEYRDLKEDWCRQNGIQYKRIEEMRKIKAEIEKRLSEQHKIISNNNRHIKKEDDTDFTEMDAIDQYYIIKFMVAAAFYPNYFRTNHLDQDNVVRDLNAKNPKSTIRIKGLPENNRLPENSHILYHKIIKNAYSICASNLIIHYDRHKAFIEFKNSKAEFNHITKISPGVYFAICMKQLRIPIKIPCLKDNSDNKNLLREIESKKTVESQKYASSYTQRITIDSDQDSMSDPTLLIKDLNEFKLVVCEITNFGHFFAQINSEDGQQLVKDIQTRLNSSDFRLKPISIFNLFVGKVIATIFMESSEEVHIYRAKITKITNTCVEVFYVDFGNKEDKDFAAIFDLDDDLARIPYQAMECKLAHVRLDPFRSADKNYLARAENEFRTIIEKCENNLFGNVYSIVDNVVRMDMYDVKSNLFRYNIADRLVKIGVCEKCDEDTISQDRHRERMNRIANVQTRFSNRAQNTNDWITVQDLEKLIHQAQFYPIDHDRPLILDGAYSPLEIKCHPMMRRSCASVRIDHSSINFVLLDDEPEIVCSSLIVAHKIENSDGSKQDLKLRNTSLFPKKLGLTSLCLLLFSPAIELRVDEKTKNTYSGALCGLGFDCKLKKALFVENDIEEVFDCKFDHHDLDDINFIRETFNKILGSKLVGERLLSDPTRLDDQRRKINETILKLMKKPRTPIANPAHFRNEYRWNQYPESYYFENSFEKNRQDEKFRRKNQAFLVRIRKVNFARMQRALP